MKVAFLSWLAFTLGTALPALALDDTQPLVCDLKEATQCDAAASCSAVSADQIDLPSVIVIDFEARRLVSEDGKRDSPISSVEVEEAVMLVQGHQHGRGWAVVLDRATGEFQASAVDPEGAFVLTGACTAR